MTLNSAAFDEANINTNASITEMTSSSSSSAEALHNEMAAMWRWRIETDPELAAALGFLSIRTSSHALDPRSIDSFHCRTAYIQQSLKRIMSIVNRDELSKDDQLSYDLYVQQLSDYVEYSPKHMAFLNCINRLEGPQNDLPLYANYLPVKTKEQREFYLKFLCSIPQQLSENVELLKVGLEVQRTPPQISLDGVVEQIRTMIDRQFVSFRSPIEGTVFPETEHDTYQSCLDQISGPITLAFTVFADFLQQEYIPHLRTEISATKGYPDGVSYYNDCLKFHTTTTMTPQEIHQLGLDEVQRVRNLMLDIAGQEGYTDKLDDYLQHLRTAPEYTPSSAEALLTHFRDITGRIAPAMLRLFHTTALPRMPFAITETPAAHATTAPAAYYLAGSADVQAPRPGMFYVNTSELPTRRLYECEALALHEAIPGHHTQGAIQGENLTLPSFRRYAEDRRYFEAPSRFPFYTGYIEGWGLHSETLGKELGLYSANSDIMGQLSMEALRSCRLVVDTGMHALGWTKEQALDFMLQNTAMGEHDAATEVARYITWPGQACAYKVGERFLHKLRTKAEEALLDKFDPRDFYDVVLQCGPIPLLMLGKLVDDYISKLLTGGTYDKETNRTNTANPSVMSDLTFLTAFHWCKCCVVPGSCQLADTPTK